MNDSNWQSPIFPIVQCIVLMQILLELFYGLNGVQTSGKARYKAGFVE